MKGSHDLTPPNLGTGRSPLPRPPTAPRAGLLSRLRIQFIIGQLTYGGSERHLVDTVLHLDRERFKIQVVCLRSGGPLAEPLKAAGVDYLEIPVIGGCGLPGWRLYRAIKGFNPRIVYTFTFVDKLWGRLAAALARTPVIITSFRNSTPAYYEPWLCKLSTAVICNSKSLQAFYRRRYNIPPERVLYLPNGIDLASRQPQNRAEARQRLGIDPEALLAAQVARLHPNKDHPTSLAAFKLVRKRLPQARLALIGHGDPAKARRLIGGLGLEESVYLLETTPRMEDVYNAADLVMLSSHHEGVPRAMVEAAAHARPLLATTVGGVDEIVRDGLNGYLVPPGDPEALAARWIELLQDEGLRQGFGQAGRRLVEEQYSLEVMMDRLMSILEELASASNNGRWGGG